MVNTKGEAITDIWKTAQELQQDIDLVKSLLTCGTLKTKQMKSQRHQKTKHLNPFVTCMVLS